MTHGNITAITPRGTPTTEAAFEWMDKAQCIYFKDLILVTFSSMLPMFDQGNIRFNVRIEILI